MRRAAILGMFGVLACGPALAGQLTVVNGTLTAIVGLQFRPSGTPAWQQDRLAANHLTLGIQKALAIAGPSACVADILVQFEDGHRAVRPHVNVCTSAPVRITEF